MGEDMKQNRRRLFHAERLAAWQEVARRLAHEIRNPLTPIQLAAERVLRQSRKGVPDIDKVIEHSLPAIISEVETIRNLVAEFANFARLPGKRPETIDLNRFLSEVVSGLGGGQPGAAILFHPAAEPLEVRFDGDQLRRMVGNLIRNSMQSIPVAGEYGLIQLVLEKDVSTWRIVVSDNGCGIAPADQDRVFTPYFSGREGGSGLGLAIVEKIVIDHGGRIGFKSVPGSGTDFILEFPLTEGERL
jgi:two-component system nitrogen regulation sensor histidine kinase NtrY